MPKTKSPNIIDVQVGRRVRALRVQIGLSQEKLGDALGITFQQVQKYEKGSNRISASRLHQIAHILSVPVAILFGKPDDGKPAPEIDGERADLFELADTMGAVKLLRAFGKIENPEQRNALIRLAQTLGPE